MDVPTDLQQLCSVLDEFRLPRAIGHITEKCLLLWNETFARHGKLTEAELRAAEISLSTDLAQASANEKLGLMPFALKISESTKVFLGHTVKRDDGYLLAKVAELLNETIQRLAAGVSNSDTATV